jgi:tellurite resistance protein TerC
VPWEQIIWWGGFGTLITAMLIFDLFVLNRKAHVVGVREALVWSAIWIGMALLFAIVIFVFQGSQKGVEYLTGYVIEKSLSVDNIFIFVIIFQYFAVPPALQPKVLRWGIMGALIMRLIFILLGVALLHLFHWMVFVFGGILLVTALRLATQKEQGVEPDKNPIIKLVRRFLPVSNRYTNGNFFTRVDGRLVATPLFVVLITIESTDLVFAVDSIPAIFAITRDPFIIFTSNAFAILGLRALYFALAGIMRYFAYLRHGLVIVLAFVGVKMIMSEFYHLPTLISLGVIATVLTISVVVSILRKTPLEDLEPALAEAAKQTTAAQAPIVEEKP